jgi:ATP-dependent RNA helicase DeaD
LNTFESLGLSTNLLKVIEEMGFTTPTPIQEKSIPLLLKGGKTDFIGLAQTGTGKTAAFGLPLIDLVDSDNKATQALIMAPTRELGQQTAKQLVDFSSNYKQLNVEVVYGGAAIMNQIKALKRPTQIVVATPGRLLDLIRRKAIRLDDVKYVVLDEADEMLNMGFKEDIDEILSYTREDRSTWLFSATMPADIRRITKKYMTDPVEVAVNTESKTNTDITHQYIITKNDDKVTALRRFLDIQPEMKGIMFCRTKRETQEITDTLGQLGYEVEALHGDLSQAQRDAAMRRFKARNMQLLIATDVAARGIDVNDLTHVLHHKIPDQLEAYTHRSGRTGRAGNKGISIAFINNREGRKISDIERKNNITFEKIEVPKASELKKVRLENWVKSTLAMPIDEEAEENLTALLPQFEALTKEDLLKRMISQELKKLKGSDKGDLNMSSDSRGSRDNDRGDRRDRGERSDRGERREFDSNRNRYFINLGKNDGLSKVDLLDFVSEVSGAKKSHINDIAVQDKRSFFNLDESQVKGFEDKFEGLELESGHAIRVNQETSGSSSGGGRSSDGGGDRGRGGRSNFGGGSGGGRRPKGAGGGRRTSSSSSSGPRSSGGPRSRRR